MEAPWRLLATGLIVLIIAMATGLGAFGVIAFSNSEHIACGQVNALRIAVTQVLENSARGLPSNPYFKHRPQDLAAAERQIHYDLSLFRPVAC